MLRPTRKSEGWSDCQSSNQSINESADLVINRENLVLSKELIKVELPL